MPTLDGWRAVAVLIVTWGHFVPGFFATESAYYSNSLLSRYGGFGVDVFFGISGLIITKLLLDEFRDSQTIAFRAFYVRRAFRILPPCFVYLAAVWLTVGLRSPLELAASVFFFRNYLPDSSGSYVTTHLWSLAVEEQFYLFWPVLLAAILARRGMKKAPVTVAWIAIACALWRITDAQNHLTARWLSEVPVHFRTDLRLDSLLWGCVAAFLLNDPQTHETLRRGFKQWMFALLVAFVVACMVLYSQLTSLWIPIAIPVALLATILHPEWAVSRWLDQPWMRWLGRISYSLYLWQMLFLIEGWDPRLAWQRFPLNLPLLFALAIASYTLVEKPCIRTGRRLSRSLREQRIAVDDVTAVFPSA